MRWGPIACLLPASSGMSYLASFFRSLSGNGIAIAPPRGAASTCVMSCVGAGGGAGSGDCDCAVARRSAASIPCMFFSGQWSVASGQSFTIDTVLLTTVHWPLATRIKVLDRHLARKRPGFRLRDFAGEYGLARPPQSFRDMRAEGDFEIVAAQREFERLELLKLRHVRLLLGNRRGDDAQHLRRGMFEQPETLMIGLRL